MIGIREIRQEDCDVPFETGKKAFDYDEQGVPVMRMLYERHRCGVYESYVLETEQGIVGVLCVKPEDDHLYLSRIGIRRDKQRKGYGSKLLIFVMRLAIRRGYRIIKTKVQEEAFDFVKRAKEKQLIRVIYQRKGRNRWWGDFYELQLEPSLI